MASQNLDVGSGANANDGQSLRSAFVNVRKMFHDIYGVSDPYTDDLDISGEDFKVNANQINTTNSAASGVDGYVLTYDHATGGFTFEEYFNGDITRVQGGSGLSGDTQSGDATINIDLNDLTEATLDVANDDIAFVDTSDSNTTRKESIADIMTAVAGSGLTATNGVLDVSVGTNQIGSDAVTPPKLDQFDDSLTAATSGDILVSNGTDFIHATMSGDATIASGGALTIGDDKITEAKLGAEFTTTAAISASAVDFSSAAIFTKTLSANTTLTFSNVTTGAVKTLVITGNFSLVLTGVTTLNGTYSGTASKNVIQIISTNGSSEMFATISNVP